MIWFIRRAIDPEAEVAFLPDSEVLTYAEATGATPFHHPGAALRNTGFRTGFDALLARENVNDPAMTLLALTIRGAETTERDLTKWSPGLRAITTGLRSVHASDDDFVAAITPVLDGLLRFCQEVVTTDVPQLPSAANA
jgi:hypothetical protein